jgi:hypothetical protein
MKTSDIETKSVENVLKRLFSATSDDFRKEWAIEITNSLKKPRPAEPDNAVSPASGEHELPLPIFARQHWKGSPAGRR